MRISTQTHNKTGALPQKSFQNTQALHQLQLKIAVEFKDQNLLKNAFVHRSYLNEHKDYKGPSNERLEFLGDAVLSIVVSDFLFTKLPNVQEGQLTQFRASLVRTETLAAIARKLDLGNYLYLSKGEEDSKGRINSSILANTYEALIGSIYLGQGLAKASEFINKTILKEWQTLIESAVVDNKSKLQEVLQKKYHKSPSYNLISTWGPDHNRNFEMGVYLEDEILGKGSGKNKQEAAQNAAENALLSLKSKKVIK